MERDQNKPAALPQQQQQQQQQPAAGEHECDLCGKKYQRRDLFVRHRRRCQPDKVVSKRKACNECARAKTRCCGTQPSCSRCAKRRIPCEYPPHIENWANASEDGSIAMARHPTTTTINSSDDGRPSTSMSHVGDMETAFPWMKVPLSLEPFDVSMQAADLSMPDFLPPVADSLMLDPAMPLMGDFGQPPPPQHASQPQPQPLDTSFDAFSMARVPYNSPPASAQSACGSISPIYTPVGDDAAATIFAILKQYPRLLLADDYRSPFLHRELYNGLAPDMTALARTSMAICCVGGFDNKHSASYIQRAINAERSNLIEAFPAYSHMQQWDALHAMWLYELLGLQPPQSLDDEAWLPQKTRAMGLQSPLLLKMTRRFCESHLEATAHPSRRGSTVSLASVPTGSSPWQQWLVGETARRTIFLANMINFFGNRNFATKQQSAYYEPVDYHMVLNMPLPCPQSVWNARTDDEWAAAMQAADLSTDILPDFSSEQFGQTQPSIKTLLATFTKYDLVAHFGKCVGLRNSDELRGLIVMSALEQFT